MWWIPSGWMGFIKISNGMNGMNTWIYTNSSRIQLLVFNGFHINFPAISLDVLAPISHIHRENHRKSDGLIWQNHRHHDPGISPWYHISLSQSHDSLLLCSSFPCFCYTPMVLEPSPLNPSFKIWVCSKGQTISPLVALVHRHFPHISIVISGHRLSWSENRVPYFPHQILGGTPFWNKPKISGHPTKMAFFHPGVFPNPLKQFNITGFRGWTFQHPRDAAQHILRSGRFSMHRTLSWGWKQKIDLVNIQKAIENGHL